MTKPAGEFALFTSWLKRQAARRGDIGSLATELRAAAGCKTLTSFRQWLRWYGAHGSVQALERAWADYQSSQENRDMRPRAAP